MSIFSTYCTSHYTPSISLSSLSPDAVSGLTFSHSAVKPERSIGSHTHTHHPAQFAGHLQHSPKTLDISCHVVLVGRNIAESKSS